MNEKEFQKVGLELVEAAKRQILVEFKLLTQMINVKEEDFETLINLNIGRLSWLQDWGFKLQQAESELLKGTLSKATATALINALQWTFYFQFDSETLEEEFKDRLKA